MGAFFLLGVAPSAGGTSIAVEQDLFDNFRAGWSDPWMVKRLASRATRFDAVTRDGETALRATSRGSAAALWRRLDLDRPTELVLSWRWRVDQGLMDNDRERTRRGDDYSATSCEEDAPSAPAPLNTYTRAQAQVHHTHTHTHVHTHQF